jgi:hypothetical protein
MKSRYKILLGVVIVGCALFSVGIGLSYYLMKQYTFLGIVFNDNPLAFLEAASRIALNRVSSTPTKSFKNINVDIDYALTVSFSKNRKEVETAEQIIEWSVAHQSQPWITNITNLLNESQIPTGDLTLHLAFIDTKSGSTPAMTLTYIRANNTQIIEKGWKERVTHNSYVGLVTEKLAIEILKHYGDDQSIIITIIQNYDGAIKVIKE